MGRQIKGQGRRTRHYQINVSWNGGIIFSISFIDKLFRNTSGVGGGNLCLPIRYDYIDIFSQEMNSTIIHDTTIEETKKCLFGSIT